MYSVLALILDFLFPPRCPICGAYVEQQGGWCAVCLARTLRVHRLPLAPEMAKALAGAWALGVYHEGLRDMILGLKYHQKKSCLPYIRVFLQVAQEQLPPELACIDLAVPVPLHPAKERQRGFNQTELIFAGWLQASLGVPYARALLRIRATEPQYGLDAKKRVQNMQRAFALQEGCMVQGRHILLVDDILTTGSTLHACAKVLKRAGAASVRALVLASDRK